MIHLMVVILSQRTHLAPLLTAWEMAGVPGVTILKGTGAAHTQSWLDRLGLRDPGWDLSSEEARQNVLLALIDNDDVLARAKAEAERIVGGFQRPDTGVLLVLPVSAACGVPRSPDEKPPKGLRQAKPSRPGLCGDTPAETAAQLGDRTPTVVRHDTALDDVARAMAAQPLVPLACVVDDTGRLIGLIDLHSLANDLFFRILPEEFLSEIGDLEEAIRFARLSGMRTAGDAMRPPVWIMRGETVRDAFRRMHDENLNGLPIVDETYGVVGYLGLLDLMIGYLAGGDDCAREANPEA